MQVVTLKAIQERNLNPENFMQAVRSVVEGIKIERETFDMKEAREVIEKDRAIFNTPEMAKEASTNKYKGNYGLFNNPAMARKCAIKEPITQSPRPLFIPLVNKPPEQTPFKPLVDPKLLEQIQEQLSEIEIKADKLKKKLEAEQAEIDSSTSLSGWH